MHRGYRRGSFQYKSGSAAPAVPVISGISVVANSSDSRYIRVAWTTDIAATSRVDIGTTGSYGTTVTDATLTTTHSVLVPGLSDYGNQLYHYRVGNISGTALSADRTHTTVRLQVPKFGNMYAGAATIFADAQVDSAGGVIATTRAAPLVAKNLTGALFADSPTTFNIWVRSSSYAMAFDDSVESNAEGGGDASINGTGTDETFGDYTSYQAGTGGRPGGGGGSAISAEVFGTYGGGPGSATDASADGGSADAFSFPGSGGTGEDYDGYTGESGATFACPSGQAGGSAGPGIGGTGGAGGGGAGHAGVFGATLNEFSANLFSSFIRMNGASIGQNSDTGGGGDGSATPDGYIVINTRKYDGTLAAYQATGFYICEWSGNQNAGFTLTAVHTDPTVVFDHLNQP